MSLLDKVFPKINDWALASLAHERAGILGAARGEVLEIGFGTGLNLAHYAAITHLHGVEPSQGMRAVGEARGAGLPFPVTVQHGFAEKLPYPDARFDTVVSTFVLCSVRSVENALREIGRVLRPGGRFIALEHVRSDDPGLAKWQDRVAPVWKVALGGCHPNRDLTGLPEKVAGLTAVRYERFMANQVRLAAPHIRGVWEKP
jgi:SAM-dependent methyltransferase